MPTVNFGKTKERRMARVKVVRRVRNPTTLEAIREAMSTLRMDLPDDTYLELLTIPAVAQELKLTTPRVLQLIRDRQLEAHRLGRIWVVLEQDLHAFVERKREEFAEKYGSIVIPPGARDRMGRERRRRQSPH